MTGWDPLGGLDTRTTCDQTTAGDPIELVIYPGALEGTVRRTPAPSGRRSALPTGSIESNITRASRRAEAEFRRFVVGNSLSQFVTLTFRDPPTLTEAVRHFRNYRRRIGRVIFRDRFPWAAVIHGRHPVRRPHVHLLLPRSDEDPTLAWDLGTAENRHLATVTDRRQVCSYLCKEFESISNEQRWLHARGFTPERLTVRVDSVDEAFDEAVSRMGPPTESRPWEGPQTGHSLRWDGPRT